MIGALLASAALVSAGCLRPASVLMKSPVELDTHPDLGLGSWSATKVYSQADFGERIAYTSSEFEIDRIRVFLVGRSSIVVPHAALMGDTLVCVGASRLSSPLSLVERIDLEDRNTQWERVKVIAPVVGGFALLGALVEGSAEDRIQAAAIAGTLGLVISVPFSGLKSREVVFVRGYDR